MCNLATINLNFTDKGKTSECANPYIATAAEAVTLILAMFNRMK